MAVDQKNKPKKVPEVELPEAKYYIKLKTFVIALVAIGLTTLGLAVPLGIATYKVNTMETTVGNLPTKDQVQLMIYEHERKLHYQPKSIEK